MSEHGEDRIDAPVSGVGHETRDISTRVVVIFAIALAAGAVLILVAVWLVFLYFGHVADAAYSREYPLAHVGAPLPPPEPRLQTQPREDLKRLRAAEEEVLHSYGWIDASAGVVHIPIERAMELTLERGLPSRAEVPGGGAQPAVSSSGRTGVPR
jgi:hypothetical protein